MVSVEGRSRTTAWCLFSARYHAVVFTAVSSMVYATALYLHLSVSLSQTGVLSKHLNSYHITNAA